MTGRDSAPGATSGALMIAHRRRDADDLLDRARERLREAGRLGPDEPAAEDRRFAGGDREVTHPQRREEQRGGPGGATVTRLLTAGEVSEILRVPRSTIYELARNRRIPFLKVGRRTLFDPELIMQWIAAQNVPPRR